MKGQAPRSGRLDVLLCELFGGSRSACAKAIDQGRVLVDGQPAAKASQGVAPGAELSMEAPQAVDSPVEREDIPLEILYQDGDLAVVVKPYGMVVHPAAGNESGTLVNALLFALEGLSGIGGVKRPGIVHRLDKDTSGLLLVAKNDGAHLALSRQLARRAMEKRYLAVVEGAMKEESGLIDVPIARSQRDRKKMAADPRGREALTRWRLLEAMKDCSLLDVKIDTGRTHQIRVHMRHIHHPVAGDPLYGHKNGVKAPRLMLHAGYLSFDHPRTGERMGFVALPPQDWVSAALKLGLGEGTLEKWAGEREPRPGASQ